MKTRPSLPVPETEPEDGDDRRPAREIVYAFVREGILTGQLAAGSFVEEAQISAATGVSRTPVREAFQRLAAEKLIELLPRRGAQVRQVTQAELIDVYDARRLLEGHAVRHLCAARLPVPAAMTTLQAAMTELAESDLIGHVALNQQFHRALVGAAGNAVLIELYDGLRARQQHVAMTAVRSKPERRAIILAEHAALLDALAAHDAAEAIAILDRHLRPVNEILSRLSAAL